MLWIRPMLWPMDRNRMIRLASAKRFPRVWYEVPTDTVLSMVSRIGPLVVLMALFMVSCAAEGNETLEPGLDTIASRGLPTAGSQESVGSVVLPDASNDGASFGLSAQPGELLVVYFGFTSCPDICPTTLADLKTALGILGDSAESVEVAMITVDPERDSPETLVEYVQWFIPGAHALRTDDVAVLTDAGDAFGASFSVVSKPDGGVEVLHTAYLYAVDDQGQIVATWPFGVEPEAIASGIETVLDR